MIQSVFKPSLCKIVQCLGQRAALLHGLNNGLLLKANGIEQGDLSVRTGFEPQTVQVRYRNIRRRIMGHPRPPIFGKVIPEPNKYRYEPIYPKVKLLTS